jgi:hypothetical protein
MAKFIVEAGCDGAMVCAFDPEALPSDFDDSIEHDPLDAMLQLQKEGRLWIDGTGGDGSFIFHIYVDEQAAYESLGDSVIEEQSEFRPIACPSGKLWICGAEYAAIDPHKGSAFTPKGGLDAHEMGECIEIPKGTHSMRVTLMDNEDHELNHPFHWPMIAEILGVLCLLIGGIGAFFSALSFTFGSLAKLFQWIVGSPLFEKGWHALPVIGGICVASIAVFLLGIFIFKRIDNMKSVIAHRAAYNEVRRQIPNYIFEIKTI